MSEEQKDVSTKAVKDEITKDTDKKEAEKPKMRQIVIETDGNNVNLIKAEVSGKIELIAIFQGIVDRLNQQK